MNVPRCYVIRHVAFEHLGLIEELLLARGLEIVYLQAGVDELTVVEREPGQLLVVLGGPIAVYEHDRYPFIDEELRLIRGYLGEDKALLGICLGAQLIAAAAGARVYPGPAKEIGWSALSPTVAGRASPLRHLSEAQWHVLHWHGDTFDLPANAELLASTGIVENQAFKIGPRVLALQFHPEVKARDIESWLIGHCCELAHAKIDPRNLRKDGQVWAKRVEDAGRKLFNEWLESALR